MGAGLIGMGLQAGVGLAQMIGGLAMKKPIIPEAEIPQEIFENMTDAEYWSYIGMPQGQRDRYVEDIQRSGATAMARSSSRKGGLGMISNIAQTEADSYRDLAEMDTKMRMQNLDRLYSARERTAEERNRVFGINRENRLMEQQRRDNLIGAGMQNVVGAGGTYASMSMLTGEDPIGDWAGGLGGGWRNTKRDSYQGKGSGNMSGWSPKSLNLPIYSGNQ